MNDSLFFPPLSQTRSDGLLALDGSLEVDWLVDAYTHGIFPWPIVYYTVINAQGIAETESRITWWSPDPRAIFEWDKIHVPKRLFSTLRSDTFEVTCDMDFSGVIHGCASAQDREPTSWVTPEMIDAYLTLHHMGIAHSVEVWHEGTLVGGVYGIAIRGFFAAESMFYQKTNASKVALVRLLNHLFIRGYSLVDIQLLTDNTQRFGAVEIPRSEYLHRLGNALKKRDVSFGEKICDLPENLRSLFHNG